MTAAQRAERMCWHFCVIIQSQLLFYLFIGLFNDAFSSSDYIVSKERVIGKLRMRKDLEGNGSGLI
jgi:hypothetical protein